MRNLNSQLKNELNIAIVDGLVDFSHDINSGLMYSSISLNKEFTLGEDVLNLNITGGIEDISHLYQDRDVVLLKYMNIIIRLKEENSVIDDYIHLKIIAHTPIDGGFGSVISRKLNEYLEKNKSIPDYVIESLNSGYECLTVNV